MSDPSLDEALSELGVENDVTPELAHRAYVRLLKKRRPEDDPAGFARLRAAYDVVRGALAEGAGATRSRLTRSEGASAARVVDEATQVLQQASAVESPDEWSLVDRAFRLAIARPGAVKPPMLIALETISVLLSLGRVDDAVTLERSVREYVKVVGETRAIPGALAIRYAVVRDLLALTGVLPRELARAVADVFLRGYPVFTLRRLVRAEPGCAARAREVLGKSTSPVAKELGPVFAAREGARRPTKVAARPSSPMTFVALAAIVLFFACAAVWIVRAPPAVASAPAVPAPTESVESSPVASATAVAEKPDLEPVNKNIAAIQVATSAGELRDAASAAAAACGKLARTSDTDYVCRYQRPVAEVRATLALLAKVPPASAKRTLCRGVQGAVTLLREGGHDSEKDVASDLTELGKACL